MNKADFKKHLEEKRKDEKEKNSTFSNDFRVALAAITTDEDFKALESQFFSKAGK